MVRIIFLVLATCCIGLTLTSASVLKYGKPPHDMNAKYNPLQEQLTQPLTVTESLELYGPEITRNGSRVNIPEMGSVVSYAGFVNVNSTTDNNLFFWYYPSQDGNPNAPLSVWLQGGPGGSSSFGNFAEIGPFRLTSDLELEANPYTWNLHSSYIFIDNPVGAGFSYTTKNGYCNDTKTCVADQLYAFMETFFTVFPEELKNDLYITGESYGGHYVPAMAYKIHEENAKSPQYKMNLKGIAIGDGWIVPINQLPGYAPLMFNIGMADLQETQVIEQYTSDTINAISNGNMLEAFDIWDQMINGDEFPYPNYFYNITHSNDYDNFMRTNSPADFGYYYKYLNQESIREAIHVGNRTQQSGGECEKHLLADFMVSFETEIATLMETYKVLIYNGQLDIIIGAPLTELFLEKLEWSGQQAYTSSNKILWQSDYDVQQNEISGYVRQVKSFTQAVVRGAGHILPFDQPQRALDMFERFVNGKSFEPTVTM